MVAAFAGDRDQLEEPLLERLGAQLDRAQDDARPRVGAPARRCSSSNCRGRRGRSRRRPSSSRRRRRTWRRHRGCGPRCPNVPLETGDLGRVGEVRRARHRPSRSPSDGGRPMPWRGGGSCPGRTRCGRRLRARRAGRALDAPSTRCRSSSAPAVALPPSQWRARASSRGPMPLRRMNAITTSMASADSISERNWLHRLGSPGALVSRVVSSSGMSGSGIAAGVPSGRRLRIA